jgi:hypothetical protein
MRAALVLALGAAGCNVVFGFDDIHPNPDANVPPPNVFSSPGPRRHSMGYDFDHGRLLHDRRHGAVTRLAARHDAGHRDRDVGDVHAQILRLDGRRR